METIKVMADEYEYKPESSYVAKHRIASAKAMIALGLSFWRIVRWL